ncbi:MAG: DNA internalization-related competence protein ComEC/Rec2 [Ignavibacteriaceae bacterium]|jgi:competence protein ComEC|nr:DNA internalization-related competence protein ComEC/Rec2 [Ignavibacteriaceae bacterium]
MLKHYPLISITIGFILGIIVQSVFQIGLYFLGFMFLFSIAFSFIVMKIIKTKIIEIPSFTYSLFPVFFFGMLLFYFQNKDEVHYPVAEQFVKDVKMVGRITDIEMKRKLDFKFKLVTDSIITANKKVTGKYVIICRVKAGDTIEFLNLYKKLNPGNVISIKGVYNKGKDTRNPGEFDYRAYLLKQGVTGFLSVKNPKDVEILRSTVSPFPSLIFSVRKSIAERIDELQKPQAVGLIKGLLLGDKSEIDNETKMEFINSGVAHVLAVSGQQVGFIAVIFIILFGRVNIYLRTTLTIITLILFLLITGLQAAVLRATIMALVVFAASLSNREINAWNTIAIAALAILLIDVNQLFDPGFQLSFVAVMATIGLYPYFSTWLKELNLKNKFVKAILVMFFMSLAAQIGVLPFINYYFGKISIIALISNLFVIPGISIILANGLLTLFVSTVSLQAANIFASAGDGLIAFLYWLIKISATQDFSFIRVPNFTLQDSIIFYGFLFFLIFTLRYIKRMFTKLLLIFLIAVNTVVFCSLDNKNLLPDDKLSVMMIDVGQGDSFLIKLPNGKTVIIDGGSSQFNYDNGARVIIPLLDYLGIAKIDYGIISHMDTDHFAGLVSLVNENRINEIFKPDLDSTDKNDLYFEQLLAIKKIPYKYFRDTVVTDEKARVYFLCDTHKSPINTFKINDRSGIVKIVYGKTSLLFVGDAHIKMEKYLTSHWKNFLDTDVLKIGHHGSKTSSGENFLNFVLPNISLVSVGEQNKFGHPSQVVLDRLDKLHSQIFRTDDEGAVILQSDGDQIKKIDWKNI